MTFAREKPLPGWMICECSRLVASLEHAILLARCLEQSSYVLLTCLGQSLTSWLQKSFEDV